MRVSENRKAELVYRLSRRTSGSGKGMIVSGNCATITNGGSCDRRLDLTAPTRSMGQRMLLREGVLMKAKSGKKLTAFLCSDVLVLTNAAARSLYRMVSSPVDFAEIRSL